MKFRFVHGHEFFKVYLPCLCNFGVFFSAGHQLTQLLESIERETFEKKKLSAVIFVEDVEIVIVYV